MLIINAQNTYLIIAENLKSLKVPKDHFLVLGDNRSNSWDGRFWPEVNFYIKRKLLGKLISDSGL